MPIDRTDQLLQPDNLRLADDDHQYGSSFPREAAFPAQLRQAAIKVMQDNLRHALGLLADDEGDLRRAEAHLDDVDRLARNEQRDERIHGAFEREHEASQRDDDAVADRDGQREADASVPVQELRRDGVAPCRAAPAEDDAETQADADAAEYGRQQRVICRRLDVARQKNKGRQRQRADECPYAELLAEQQNADNE